MYQVSILRLAAGSSSSLSLVGDVEIVDEDGVVLRGGGVMVPLGGGGVVVPRGGIGGGVVLVSSIEEPDDRNEADLLLPS